MTFVKSRDISGLAEADGQNEQNTLIMQNASFYKENST